MRKFKRLSAIILSFSILLSCCRIGFSVSAETQSQGEWIHQGAYADMPSEIPFTLSDSSIGAAVSGKTIDYAEGYANLLAGKEYEIFVYKNDIYKIDTVYGGATWDRMNDNLYNLTEISYDENGTVGEIVFHNENTITPEYFVWLGRPEADYNVAGFEIYGANTYSDVRNSTTPIASYTKAEADDDVDHQVLAYKFSQSASTFKYFRVVLKGDNINSVNGGYRFCELMLLGKETNDGVAPMVKQSDVTTVPTENALTAQTVECYTNGVLAPTALYNKANLQDGNGTSSSEASIGYHFTSKSDDVVTWYTDGERTADLIYDLGSVHNINKVLLVNHNTKLWRARHYQIYASINRDDLFKEESLVVNYENICASQTNLISTNDNTIVRYVAIRYINPVTTTSDANHGNIYPRIYEFRVYGTVYECGNNHTVMYLEKKEPSVFADGYEAHYECKYCAKAFSDQSGTVELAPDDYVLSATGYIYHQNYSSEANFHATEFAGFSGGGQGSAMYGDYIVAANRYGQVWLHDMKTASTLVTFRLATYNEGTDNPALANHSNSLSFSNVKFKESDPFPLLYVSTGNGTTRDETGAYVNKCAIERILYSEEKGWYSELVQLIEYNDFENIPEQEGNPDKLMGDYSLSNMYNPETGEFEYISGGDYDAAKGYQKTGRGIGAYLVDPDPTEKTAGKLYFLDYRFQTNLSSVAKDFEYYGFTTQAQHDAANAQIYTEFKHPDLPTSETDENYGATVTLTPADITDQIVTPYAGYHISQGSQLYSGRIYTAFGNRGTETQIATRNGMIVTDLIKRKIVGKYDLYKGPEALQGAEPEDVMVWNGEIVVAAITNKLAMFVFDYLALDDAVVTSSPTCSANGESHIECVTCGYTLASSDIPATGEHNFQWVIDSNANCGNAGKKHEKCINDGCNAVQSENTEIPATGNHTWNAGVVAKKATCTATGVKTYTCSVCSDTKDEAIAKTSHSYKTTTTKATTSKDGSIVKKCSCGKVSSTTKIYKIKTIKLSKTTYSYSGKANKPTVTVKDSKGNKVDKKYYEVKYTNHTKIGRATAKVTFKGNYSGTKSLTFTINPAKVSNLKLKSSKKKQLTVSWKKDTKVSGYEIVYATNSKFTKGKKTVKITSYKTYKKTIKKLKSKGTYYVKVRAYKTVSGKKYYGEYCKAQKLKIK